MIGAYVIWGAMVLLNQPFFVALGLAVLTTGIFGAVSYRLIFQHLQYIEQQFLAFLVASIGLMMIMAQAVLLIFGTQSRGVKSVFTGVVKIGEVGISIEKLILIILALLLTFGLYFLLQETNIGRAMRAVAFRADVSALQGINPNITYMATMAVGCAIAGFAGGIMAPVYAIYPGMDNIILPILLVVMLGGMGSMLGAILGGLILGITLAFGHYFIGSGLAQIILFVVIGIIVYFRPGGLFGKAGEEIAL